MKPVTEVVGVLRMNQEGRSRRWRVPHTKMKFRRNEICPGTCNTFANTRALATWFAELGPIFVDPIVAVVVDTVAALRGGSGIGVGWRELHARSLIVDERFWTTQIAASEDKKRGGHDGCGIEKGSPDGD